MKSALAWFSTGFRVAILHRGEPVPAINGVIKPLKPGGYQDSSADLAYNLKHLGETVITPTVHPDPSIDSDWSFPDTVHGIEQALDVHSVNVFWANTTLHSQHALVRLREKLVKRNVRMIGQSPLDTEKYEDKEWINRWLASHRGLEKAFPRSGLFTRKQLDQIRDFGVPLVIKPVRGRGSHGVTMVETEEDALSIAKKLLEESDAVLVEEYLSGEEITITVMPPGKYDDVGIRESCWSLPVVTRFNHANGIAPYNGIVAVTANSRAVTVKEHSADEEYTRAQHLCELVAQSCRTTAPIRIDCRRRTHGGEFVLFDVNMKPNATGPGRPGRDEQASLVTMAAEAIGWDYPKLIVNVLAQARLVEDVIRR